MTSQEKLDAIVETIKTGDHDCHLSPEDGCNHPIHE